RINGVDCSKISKVQMNAQSRMPQFLQRQVDLVTVYANNELPLIEAQAKQKFVMLDMPKHGFAIPGLAVVTSDALIASKPDVLKRFLRATSEGIKEMKAHPDEAAKATAKNWSGAPDLGVIEAQVKVTAEEIPVPPGKTIGWI